MKTNETEHRISYEIVYSKDLKNIIPRSEWLYQKDWKNYKALAVKVIYNLNGSIDSRDISNDTTLWVSASLDNHEDLAINKRKVSTNGV